GANSGAVSPLSLCVQSTPGCRTLAASPLDSVIRGSPIANATRVLSPPAAPSAHAPETRLSTQAAGTATRRGRRAIGSHARARIVAEKPPHSGIARDGRAPRLPAH